MKPTRRRPRRSEVIGYVVEALFAGLCLTAVVTAGSWIAPRLLQPPRPLPQADTAAADANLRTGTVVVRMNNISCRRVAFDNETGLFHDAAIEPCDDILYPSRPGAGGNNISSLRDSFNRRPTGWLPTYR
jgi:hypothetical protein